jgi:hypothetical protein
VLIKAANAVIEVTVVIMPVELGVVEAVVVLKDR